MVRAVLVCFGLLFVPAVLGGQDSTRVVAEAQPDHLRLRPGDAVRIHIWREGDLSGEFLIDEQGDLTVPLLGSIAVSSIPMGQVRDSLLTLYARQLRNPSIVITLLRRVNVLGEVQRPGVYSLDPTITLAGAVAIAGGATPSGDVNRIRIIRGGQVYLNRAAPGQTLDAVNIQSGDQLFVERRSWFDRNSTFIVSLVVSVAGIAISLITAGS